MSTIRDALDAVRAAVRAEFPASEIQHFHVSQMPQDFTRPALYVQMIPGRTDRMTANLLGFPSSWQVVYFPEEDADGLVDNLALIGVADRMTDALGRVTTLMGPGGTVYNVDGFSCDVREGLGYFTVDLWTSERLEEPAADKMQDIYLALNGQPGPELRAEPEPEPDPDPELEPDPDPEPNTEE